MPGRWARSLVVMSQRLSDIDLHDGQILSTSIDHKNRTLAIEVLYYASMEDESRTPARVSFSSVVFVSAMIEALTIEDNVEPGNISFWQPAEGAGTTFIYLVGGTLAITAGSTSFETGHDV